MPQVNRYFNAVLSSEFVRLRFCAHVFYHAHPDIVLYADIYAKLGRLQREMICQRWFSLDFARKLEVEVLRLQEPSLANRERARSLDVSVEGPSKPEYIKNEVRCGCSKIPNVLLETPWTKNKAKLCRLLVSWGAPIRCRREFLIRSLDDAVEEGNSRALKVLVENFGLKLTHAMFKTVILSRWNRIIIEALVFLDVMRGKTFIQWDDEELWDWAQQRAEGGDAKAQWLVKVLNSEGLCVVRNIWDRRLANGSTTYVPMPPAEPASYDTEGDNSDSDVEWDDFMPYRWKRPTRVLGGCR